MPDSLLEALNDQNIALAREEVEVDRFVVKNPIFAEIIHYTNKVIQFLNLTINCRSSIYSRKTITDSLSIIHDLKGEFNTWFERRVIFFLAVGMSESPPFLCEWCCADDTRVSPGGSGPTKTLSGPFWGVRKHHCHNDHHCGNGSSKK